MTCFEKFLRPVGFAGGEADLTVPACAASSIVINTLLVLAARFFSCSSISLGDAAMTGAGTVVIDLLGKEIIGWLPLNPDNRECRKKVLLGLITLVAAVALCEYRRAPSLTPFLLLTAFDFSLIHYVT